MKSSRGIFCSSSLRLLEASVIHTENQDHDSNELITWALIKLTVPLRRPMHKKHTRDASQTCIYRSIVDD